MMKSLIQSPKVQQAEPACINDANSDKLNTDNETIKKVSLEHCIKILSKNKIREEDVARLDGKSHRVIIHGIDIKLNQLKKYKSYPLE